MDVMVSEVSGYEQGALLQVQPHVQDLSDMIAKMEAIDEWKKDTIGDTLKQRAKSCDQPLKTTMTLCRVALLGRTESPPVFGLMEFLGKKETLARLRHLATQLASSP